MAEQTKAEILIDQFSKWACCKENKRLTKKSADSYKSYLRNFPVWYNKAIELSSSEKLENKLPKEIINKVLYFLELLIEDGDRLYAITLSRMMINLTEATKKLNTEERKRKKKEIKDTKVNLKETLKEYDKASSNLSKSCSAYTLLGDYILELKYGTNSLREEEKLKLDAIRGQIDKKDLCHQLDGMSELLAEVGEKRFFKIAIESSYFFAPELLEIEPVFHSKQYNYDGKEYTCHMARNTTDKKIKKKDVRIGTNKKGTPIYSYIYKFNKIFRVVIDPNGNRFVCELLNGLTNLNLGSGKDTIIQNTIISHVWGRAYDPRYFTSLWNIVLIPAWANSLMDKEGASPKSLASKMRATYMKICNDLYFKTLPNINYWKNLQLKKAPGIVNPKDVQNGDYSINVIYGKKNDKDNTVTIRKESRTI